MSDAPMSNAMKLQKVSIRLLALSFMLLITSPAMTCMAQRNAARKIDKELFDKKRRGRAFDDKIKDRGAAGKAIEEQKKKESERKKDGGTEQAAEIDPEGAEGQTFQDAECCHTGTDESKP